MALKRRAIIGSAIALFIVLAAVLAGELRVKADGQTWSSVADTTWYDPTYTTYKINNVAQLAGVAKLVNEDSDGTINGFTGKILEVTPDVLAMADYLWVPIGTGEKPFKGTLITLDGKKVTVQGMKIPSNLSYQGLVGNMIGGSVGGFTFAADGQLSVSSATYDVFAGAAVGKMSGYSIVFNVTNHISIDTDAAPYKSYVGGIVGMGEGSIANSVNDGSIQGNGTVHAGGIVGYGDAAGLALSKVSNSGMVTIDAGSGDSAFAGGVAGYALGRINLGDVNMPVVNTANVTVTGGTSVYAGGLLGKGEGDLLATDVATNSGNVVVEAPQATGSYVGGLAGAIGNANVSQAMFSITGEVKNNGGSNVHTGAIAGYVGSNLQWTKAYSNVVPVTASGSEHVFTGGLIGKADGTVTFESSVKNTVALTVTGNANDVYTGGIIGYAGAGLVSKDMTTRGNEQSAVIQVTGGTGVYTGGFAGLDKNGLIGNATFTGRIEVVGSGPVFTGGIVGRAEGSRITGALAGNTAGTLAEITSNGTIGGIAGYLTGTIDGATVRYIKLNTLNAGGVIGGVAGDAQGEVLHSAVGAADAANYESVVMGANVTSPEEGQDNITAGGVVGLNEQALRISDAVVTRVNLITESGKSGYTYGGVAGKLTSEAHLGDTDSTIEVKDLKITFEANNIRAGGAVGIHAGTATSLAATRINFEAKADGSRVGGLFGENGGAVSSSSVSTIVLTSGGANSDVGGVVGFNTGFFTDAVAQNVVIDSNGAKAAAGGIAGRAAGNTEANQRASFVNPVLKQQGDLVLITLKGTESIGGGIVGAAAATDIVNPIATADTPDFVSLSVQATKATVGGLAGTIADSSIRGDTTAVNLTNMIVSTSTATDDAVIGGFVGSSSRTRVEKLVGKTVNLNVNGKRSVVGGMVGYNLGSATGVITTDYLSGLSLKVNASATSSTSGGIVGVNDAQSGDPAANPGSAISTIQNSRALGTINVVSATSLTGGMVGENRSLIANNSITDKINVSTKGNNAIVGGLAGRNSASGTLYYTYSNANLTIEGEGTLAGGLVGENAGAVKSSYVDIDINGKAYGTSAQSVFLGGLIGRNSAGAVEQSYSASKVTADGSYTIAGGLIGELTGGSVKNTYVAKTVTANKDHSYAGGFVGRIVNGKITSSYSAAEVTVGSGAYAGGFAGRYDNVDRELLYKNYYIKDEAKNINTDLPDFAEGKYRFLNAQARLSTILSSTLADRTVFPGLSGWDFSSAWKYGSLNAVYKYPEVNREANSGGDIGEEVNANINWYMRDKDAIRFQLTSEAELAGLAAIVNGSLVGVEPFDFAGRTITVLNPIHIQSKQWAPIGAAAEHPFQGTFDGGNFLIDGLTVVPAYANSGLFGVIGEQAQVSNINLEPESVVGDGFTGSVAGMNAGKLSNVKLTLSNGATVSGNTIGGIVGQNTGKVSGLQVTVSEAGRIEVAGNNGIVGGLIGDNATELKVEDILVFNGEEGSIGSATEHATVGGLVGKQSGNVSGFRSRISSNFRIFATGSDSTVGGLIGRMESGTAEGLALDFDGGSMHTQGADSILGGIIGESKAGVKIKNAEAKGAGTGNQLTGNGTIGGIVGKAEGAGQAAFDIENVKVQQVGLSSSGGSLDNVIGGVAGYLKNVAVQNASTTAVISASAEDVEAGSIVGRGDDSILYAVEAVSDIQATIAGGTGSVGGIAGAMQATNLNLGLDFGKAYPLYKGIYEAKLQTGKLSAKGTSNRGDLWVGGIVGQNANASIYESSSAADIDIHAGNKASAGGIAGYSSGIIVQAEAVSGIVADTSLEYNIGGLIGKAENGEVHYSNAIAGSGKKIVVGSALTVGQSVPSTRAGGFIGAGDHVKIIHAYADIPVEVTDDNQDNTIFAGGFAGLLGDSEALSGSIANSYASGNVKVNGKLGAYAGGFAGSVNHYTITDAYASGTVTNTGMDTRTGGFAANVERDGKIEKSYAIQSVVSASGVKGSTRSYTGGFAGYNDGILTGVYANVPAIEVNITGANVFKGALVGYNFRDGSVKSSTYTGTIVPVGHNAGLSADALAVAAYQPAKDDRWNNDLDATFFTGYADGEITVETAEQLKGAAFLYNDTGLSYYRLFDRAATEKPKLDKVLLGSDIQMDGQYWVPFQRLTDVIDGQGHRIIGLNVKSQADNTGFVNTNEGVIANIVFENAVIAGGKNAGIAAGTNGTDGMISGVQVQGFVTAAENAGGAAGINKGKIFDVAADVNKIDGVNQAGGVVGTNEGTLDQSTSAGVIVSKSIAGGIAGDNLATGIITKSFSYADVQVDAELATAGGIAGINRGKVEDSYSAGYVHAKGSTGSRAGGVVGYAADGSIAHTVNTGEIVAEMDGRIVNGKAFFGGIAGLKANAATIDGSVFNKQMLKSNIAYYEENGKLVPGTSIKALGKTGAELTKGTLPEGFDPSVWTANPNFYPELAAFGGSVDSSLSAAAIVIDDNQSVNSIASAIRLSGGPVTWSADAAQVTLQQGAETYSGTLKTNGIVVLKASLEGKSREVTVNRVALLFSENASKPEAESENNEFTDKVVVKLKTAEAGGKIYYTVDGSQPSGSSKLYGEPITLTATTTIRAITIVQGKENSPELMGVWKKVEPVSMGPGGPAPTPKPSIVATAGKASVDGTATAPVTVARNSKLKLSAPEGQIIYYTTDGSTPTKDSPIFKGEFVVTKNMTIKAITDKDDRVVTIEYVVENAKYNLKSDADSIKYIAPYSNDLFKPSVAITRYELIEALAPLLDMEDVDVAASFNDVKAEDEKLAAFFASAGILEGYPNGGFGGERGLTRAEFSVIMTRVLNLDIKDTGVTKQSDLKGHWAEKYVNALSKAGYVKGFPNGTFKPDSSITRAEAVVLINRIVGTKKSNMSTAKFKDLPVTHWAYKDIMSVVQ
ncbi:chitobiase/beta-hexosaminidase C-terminal domain-containing protein [Cohnella sp. GbtcB17]|uniref:chitobiase/beta-hexosaminidase C-terminal domain-containing protein n=1 Tax=Cohnella sp. GbtcB17 TaxID=2824762 RepID=UPI001C3069E3|nr:chitobiase/beta-hexosaminidase C-terminal domain-containing protein [Cohnella sp. GbtcB17]